MTTIAPEKPCVDREINLSTFLFRMDNARFFAAMSARQTMLAIVRRDPDSIAKL